MRYLLLILMQPLYCFAQHDPEFKTQEKLFSKARIISDSGIIKGYFVTAADSSVILSSTKRYSNNTIVNIPVNTIQKLQVKNKLVGNLLGVTVGSVIGFILAAGLVQNNTDIDDDGKTSFWELVFSAIEGTTSGNRKRRNTAFVAGAAGGTLFMVVGIFSNKKISFTFPINNRNTFYNEKKSALNDYMKF